MSSAAKKTADVIDAVDLVALLTPPGSGSIFDAEITSEVIETQEPVSPVAVVEQTDEEKTLLAIQSAVAGPAMTSSPKPAAIKQRKILKPVVPVENDSLHKIAAEVSKCQNCELYQHRNKTVPGMGSDKARLVIIGEAPGADEDQTGIPFVGKAGKHLDKIIAAAGFNRDELFICNILKCRPPNNRDPKVAELQSCSPFLQRQLQIIKPAMIACLGNTAIKYVIGTNSPGITRIHGQWFQSIFSIPTMALYHPSYLIRSTSREKGSPNWQMWQDIQALKKAYDKL